LSLYGAADDNTTGAGPAPAVTEAPVNVALPLAALTVNVAWNVRVCVDAATVVVHGETWLAVAAVGPLLPADAATRTPAAYASRKASSTGSVAGFVPPEMEKLITSTPSTMAWPTAAAESVEKQPWMPQTLYTDTHAPGAMPWTGPRSTPSTSADGMTLPALVVPV